VGLSLSQVLYQAIASAILFDKLVKGEQHLKSRIAPGYKSYGRSSVVLNLLPGDFMLYPPLALPLKKLWQLIAGLWSFLKTKTQAVFDFFMDRLLTYLCRYYQPAFE
jgi:hypothetical protein